MKRTKNAAHKQRGLPFGLNRETVLFSLALVTACIALYAHTTTFTYTELDDTIFIRELEPYTRGDSYMRSFSRGVFSDTADTYYRPLLLNSFVWDRHREGNTSSLIHSAERGSDDISQYRWTNIVLHCVATLLVFFLLQRMFNDNIIAFILTLMFAVHPALAQTVAWIPGRNDSLLAVFAFAFMLSAIEYVRSANVFPLVLQCFFLLGALFTKETGIIVAPVAFALVVFLSFTSWKSRELWFAAASWIAATGVWLAVRSSATIESQEISAAALLSSFVERLPVLIQYFGKAILPFNLSVFPWQEDTTSWFGIIGIILVAIGIVFTPKKNWRLIAVGCLWFVLFTIPVLVIPKSINREVFEHRLYLPMVGILILIAQTALVQRVNRKRVLYGGLILCAALAAYNYSRSGVFSNKFTFWESAVATTPSSAYAKMMLGARYYRDAVTPRKEEGVRLLEQAYAIDSTQKYLNYYLGSVMMDRGDWKAMDEFLKKETAPDIPIRIEMYSNRARGYIERKMYPQAEEFLLKWIALAPREQAPHTNLLLLYTSDYPQHEKARAHAQQLIAQGIPVAPQLLQAIGLSQSSPSPHHAQ